MPSESSSSTSCGSASGSPTSTCAACCSRRTRPVSGYSAIGKCSSRVPSLSASGLDDLLVGQPAGKADRVGLELLADQGQRALEVLAGAGAREPGAQVLEPPIAGGDPAAADRAGAQRLGEGGPADLGGDRRDHRPRLRRAARARNPAPTGRRGRRARRARPGSRSPPRRRSPRCAWRTARTTPPAPSSPGRSESPW